MQFWDKAWHSMAFYGIIPEWKTENLPPENQEDWIACFLPILTRYVMDCKLF